jgi:hypothetical protein
MIIGYNMLAGEACRTHQGVVYGAMVQTSSAKIPKVLLRVTWEASLLEGSLLGNSSVARNKH